MEGSRTGTMLGDKKEATIATKPANGHQGRDRLPVSRMGIPSDRIDVCAQHAGDVLESFLDGVRGTTGTFRVLQNGGHRIARHRDLRSVAVLMRR